MPQFQILLAALPAGETWSCGSSFKYNEVLKEACQHISVLYTYTWVAGTSLTAQLPQTIVYSTLCVSYFSKSQSFTLQQRSYICIPEKKKKASFVKDFDCFKLNLTINVLNHFVSCLIMSFSFVWKMRIYCTLQVLLHYLSAVFFTKWDSQFF